MIEKITKMRKFFLSVLAAVCVAIIVDARSVRDFFVSEKIDAFNLVEPNRRTEMLAYYDVGRIVPADNNLGGKSALVKVTDNYLAVDMSAASRVEMLMLTSGRDTVIYVVNTVKLPAADSRFTVLNANCEPLSTEKMVKLPEMCDFITMPKGAAISAHDVLNDLRFPLISLSIDDSAMILTAKQNLRDFRGKEEYGKIAPYMTDSIEFERSGVRFKRKK